MSDDIVRKLLRFEADLMAEINDGQHGSDGENWVIPFGCLRQAANEIERLRAELRKYTGDGHNTKGEPCTQNTPS